MFLTAVPLALASLLSLVSSEEVVKVQFFGEAQCPFCRKFVQEAWPSVWEDSDLMQYVQYDFVAWGNAYFQIQKCSRGDDTYNADERKCWYANCSPIDRQGGNAVQYEDDCFSGKVIYQHSAKEGQVDIYENCVKYHYGIEVAVDFTYCAEGDTMENTESAHDLLLACHGDIIDPDVIQSCYETHGHTIEVLAAKLTPAHPGVPYVLVDGEPLDDPFSIQQAICDRLREIMGTTSPWRLPKACETQHEYEDMIYQ